MGKVRENFSFKNSQRVYFKILCSVFQKIQVNIDMNLILYQPLFYFEDKLAKYYKLYFIIYFIQI